MNCRISKKIQIYIINVIVTKLMANAGENRKILSAILRSSGTYMIRVSRSGSLVLVIYYVMILSFRRDREGEATDEEQYC